MNSSTSNQKLTQTSFETRSRITRTLSKINNQFQAKRNATLQDEFFRGVNIGGWLVLEPWITPSLFNEFDYDDVVDEYTFCEYLGKEECKNRLEEHWSSFLSQEDLYILKDSGLNTIRIPVGYWLLGDILEDEPWVTGSDKHLDNAISWAQEVGLDVIIDLHCGPGSQNGFDNSGRRGEIHWDDQDPSGHFPNVERTIGILEKISDKYIDMPNVIGLEFMNEIFVTVDLNLVKEFYMEAYKKTTPKFEDKAFVGDSFRFWDWFNFMPWPEYENVYLDTHHYEMFDTYVLGFSEQEHIDNVCQNVQSDLTGSPLWPVVGEWSLATTDCARWLNGYGRGARWDMTYMSDIYFGTCEGRNDSSTFTDDYRNFLNRWAEYQMSSYEAGKGWFFWTFKTEEAPQWDYLQGLKEGWIPNQKDRTHKCPPVSPVV